MAQTGPIDSKGTPQHRQGFAANPIGILAAVTFYLGIRGEPEHVVAKIPVQPQAKSIIRTKPFAKNEHRAIPESGAHNDLVAGSQHHIRFRSISYTGQIQSDNSFAILANNSA